MNTLNLLIIAFLSLAYCVQADKTVAAQRKPIAFQHYQGKHMYIVDYVVNAKTFYPELKDYMDNWFQVVNYMTSEARVPPTQAFWDTFYETESFAALQVSDYTYYALHNNAPHYELRCEVEIDITASPGVQLGIDTMRLYSDGRIVFQMLTQYPKVRKVGGYGELKHYNSRVVRCYKMPAKAPDQTVVLKRNFTPFKHSSFFGGKVKFDMQNVIQPIDLLQDFSPNNNDLVNVAYGLNVGARRRLTVADWKMFLNGDFTAMSVTDEVYKALTHNIDQWRYVCTFEVEVPSFSLFTNYKIESMEILTQGNTLMNVVDQRPHVSIIHQNGDTEIVEARVLSCSRPSTMNTASKAFKPAAVTNVIKSCTGQDCKKQTTQAVEFFQQIERDELAKAQAIISAN